MGERYKSLFWPVISAVLFGFATVGLIVYVLFVLDEQFLVWLTNIPIVPLHLGIIVFWSLFTLIVWWIAERSFDHDFRDDHKEAAQRLLLVVSSFFVFMLGFVVSQEWSNVNEVRGEVSGAAAAIDTAIYKTEALPEPHRSDVLNALNDLGSSIACEDIPSIRNTGEGSPQTSIAMKNTFLALVELPPSIQDMSIFQDLLDEVGAVSEARGQMIAGSAGGLPPAVIFTIFFVAGLLVIMFVVQLAKGRRSHLALTLGLILLICVGTGLVLTLSRPFGGSATMDEDFARASQQTFSCISKS